MVLKNAAGKEVLRKNVRSDASGRGGLLATFERPGAYQIEVRNLNGTKIGRGVQVPFTVASEYPGIELDSPLVGGEPIDSNRFTGKRLTEFDVVLRWKPSEGSEQYRLTVKNRAGRSIVDQAVTGTSFAFPKGKIYSEPLTYSVRAEYPNGYTAVSKQETFMFNFNSPTLTLPENGAMVSLGDPSIGKKGGVIFTWERTTFTQSYDFEIAADAQFTRILKRVSNKENFLVFRGLKPAEYWWRVRAVNGNLKSPAGAPFKITVTP
jgi:hypothetical protein